MTATYDPISATVFRLALPGGDDFLQDNLAFMRETYGDAVADALYAAHTENDLARAEEFAALLVDDFSYEIERDDAEAFGISYRAADGVSGSLKINRSGHFQGDILVHAVLSASESIWSRARIEAEVAQSAPAP